MVVASAAYDLDGLVLSCFVLSLQKNSLLLCPGIIRVGRSSINGSLFGFLEEGLIYYFRLAGTTTLSYALEYYYLSFVVPLDRIVRL
jgi:hypothetical protein